MDKIKNSDIQQALNIIMAADMKQLKEVMYVLEMESWKCEGEGKTEIQKTILLTYLIEAIKKFY